MSDYNTENGLEELRTRTFNPNEHVIQLKSKSGSADYLPVQWRLVWFREQCPHGTIETEEIEVDLDREMEEEGYAWNNETRRSEKIMKRAKGYARLRSNSAGDDAPIVNLTPAFQRSKASRPTKNSRSFLKFLRNCFPTKPYKNFDVTLGETVPIIPQRIT